MTRHEMGRSAVGESASLRIGELARRTGVGASTLRAWQRRYGLPEPIRSASGYRLYSEGDARLVSQLARLVAEGMAISQAVQLVRDRRSGPDGRDAVRLDARDGAGFNARDIDASERSSTPPPTDSAALDPAPVVEALLSLDGARTNRELDGLLARFSLTTVLEDILLPAMREIGDRQAAGSISVAHEHFASNLIRGRIWGFTRSWDAGRGPLAVLACAPNDLHENALLMFGLALREQGWRVGYLGAATPATDAANTARRLGARVLLVSFTGGASVSPEELASYRGLGADNVAVVFGGPSASAEAAAVAGALLLDQGQSPVSAARCWDALLASAS